MNLIEAELRYEEEFRLREHFTNSLLVRESEDSIFKGSKMTRHTLRKILSKLEEDKLIVKEEEDGKVYYSKLT